MGFCWGLVSISTLTRFIILPPPYEVTRNEPLCHMQLLLCSSYMHKSIHLTCIVVVPSTLLKTRYFIPLPFTISKYFDPWQLSVSQRPLCIRYSYLLRTHWTSDTCASSLSATLLQTWQELQHSEVFLINTSCTGFVPILRQQSVLQV